MSKPEPEGTVLRQQAGYTVLELVIVVMCLIVVIGMVVLLMGD